MSSKNSYDTRVRDNLCPPPVQWWFLVLRVFNRNAHNVSLLMIVPSSFWWDTTQNFRAPPTTAFQNRRILRTISITNISWAKVCLDPVIILTPEPKRYFNRHHLHLAHLVPCTVLFLTIFIVIWSAYYCSSSVDAGSPNVFPIKVAHACACQTPQPEMRRDSAISSIPSGQDSQLLRVGTDRPFPLTSDPNSSCTRCLAPSVIDLQLWEVLRRNPYYESMNLYSVPEGAGTD